MSRYCCPWLQAVPACQAQIPQMRPRGVRGRPERAIRAQCDAHDMPTRMLEHCCPAAPASAAAATTPAAVAAAANEQAELRGIGGVHDGPDGGGGGGYDAEEEALMEIEAAAEEARGGGAGEGRPSPSGRRAQVRNYMRPTVLCPEGGEAGWESMWALRVGRKSLGAESTWRCIRRAACGQNAVSGLDTFACPPMRDPLSQMLWLLPLSAPPLLLRLPGGLAGAHAAAVDGWLWVDKHAPAHPAICHAWPTSRCCRCCRCCQNAPPVPPGGWCQCRGGRGGAPVG